MRLFWMLLVLASFLTPAAADPVLVLDKVVIFSRHGVRPPTSQKALDPLSLQPWPSWAVGEGELTPHGAKAAARMGQYYRSAYVRPDFLGSAACPGDELFAWADDSERTRATGTAILAGLFPGCGLVAGFAAEGAAVLFHPIQAGVAPLDPDLTLAGMLAALGGSLDAAKSRYREGFAELASVLHGPVPAACAAAELAFPCALIDLPWGLKIDAEKGNAASLSGPLKDASTVAEVIRMEYSDDMPLDQVGWGRVGSAAKVASLLALHEAQYDATLRVPYIARREASQLLHQIGLALRQGSVLAGSAGDGPPPAKLVLFVGHDTNIVTLQATLGTQWQLEGYPPNDTPPAGALVFERWRDAGTGALSVRLAFVAQGMEAIRNLAPPTGAGAPERAVLPLPGCPPAAQDPCALVDFIAMLEQRIDPTALRPVRYAP